MGERKFLHIKDMSEAVADRLRSHPAVAAVEENREVWVSEMEKPTMWVSGGWLLYL